MMKLFASGLLAAVILTAPVAEANAFPLQYDCSKICQIWNNLVRAQDYICMVRVSSDEQAEALNTLRMTPKGCRPAGLTFSMTLPEISDDCPGDSTEIDGRQVIFLSLHSTQPQKIYEVGDTVMIYGGNEHCP
jgi:hypothetical protein